MPELPEMENYKIFLNQKVVGKTITAIQVNREKSINVTIEVFKRMVQNQTIVAVNRRGKHLLFHLQNGQVLLLHLMLGGWIFYGTEADKPKRTIQVQLSFDDHHLYFIGLRLGYLHLHTHTEAEQKLSHLGPEPLESGFTQQVFLNKMAAKHGRLKTTLLDQGFIAGIGNCYSTEICFKAGVLPAKDIDDIERTELIQIYNAMKAILQDAIKHGGYLENPFFNGDTLTGSYSELCQVYDREGGTCHRCGAVIVKEMISSRKTFYCPNCQK
ncbi:bifunctional DNA-formamidopyrimidine glycosylase/DNA-(apurinic or apyrimidinic site) lyase [Neobacillus mesonae]|uniref:bifunctional DNA-formamidopyrimidine glycosylase/DNA-(apurinic or apyrimidinic site) lyase n=1 Tax=Neobacillus mesonae TaxID=1193713 RepID=UPI0020418A95|nr:bifunctional DNA-formamidopyrimidine glycosylase/DNA-(apurinic or apyrimidinic site) lyase [Neobacillus mesonae]MCM3571483.1 bifunctional DNA-formamidopyrimidine glycosylase/DNA-(apurinic or apyrimidinic site) lyase [Neobacillus mesonae]